MLYYRDKIELPDHLTLADAQHVAEEITGVGRVIELNRGTGYITRSLSVEFEAEDRWDMHELLADLATSLNSWSLHFVPDKTKLSAE